MGYITLRCRPACDHTLTAESFSRHWETSGIKREVALVQIEKVLSSYEKAQAAMSRQGIHLLYSCLETIKRIECPGSDASSHIAYRLFRGQWTYGARKGLPRLWYPFFFVVQALFPESQAVRSMYLDMERIWGVRLNSREPFYPRLNNPKLERMLILGCSPDQNPNNPEKSAPRSPYPGLSTGQSIATSPELSNSSTTQQPSTAQKASSASNTINDEVANKDVNNTEKNSLSHGEQFSNIEGHLEKRVSDLQSQLDEYTARLEVLRRTDDIQGKIEKIQEHARADGTKAQEYVESAKEHAVQAEEHATQARECNNQARVYSDRAKESLRIVEDMVKSLTKSSGAAKRSSNDGATSSTIKRKRGN